MVYTIYTFILLDTLKGNFRKVLGYRVYYKKAIPKILKYIFVPK